MPLISEGIQEKRENMKNTRSMRREGREDGYNVRLNHPKTQMSMMKISKEENAVKVDESCKPRKQSEFRGKCRRGAGCRYCHSHTEAASKWRGGKRIKGLHKHTSTDLLSSYRRYAWRVVADRNPHHRLSSTNYHVGHSSSDFISSFAQGGDDNDYDYDYDCDCMDDDQSSHTSTSTSTSTRSEEEVIERRRVELDDSDSWTTEILCDQTETDLEEWCLVNEEMYSCVLLAA